MTFDNNFSKEDGTLEKKKVHYLLGIFLDFEEFFDIL